MASLSLRPVAELCVAWPADEAASTYPASRQCDPFVCLDICCFKAGMRVDYNRGSAGILPSPERDQLCP